MTAPNNVVAFTPRPRPEELPINPGWARQTAADRRKCIYHLRKLAKDWGIRITVHPKGGTA